METNGDSACSNNILVEDGGTIIIQGNLIETSAALGIEIVDVDGVTVSNNNIL